MRRRDAASAAGDALALLRSLDKEELVRIAMDDAKNWLAHDGLWFQAIESARGIDEAIAADRAAWERFTVVEARRIMERLEIAPGGGIPALIECLRHRMYARLNVQDCRVQAARRRRGLPDFPCKPVGVVEYAGFASTIDPRIVTSCIACPPDEHAGNFWCAWEFTVADGAPGPTSR
jgi:hypothetical protein